MDAPAPANRFAAWVVLVGALAIPCVYLPTLGTRFDFIDDGNLVYPAPPMPLGPRLQLVWEKVVANYDHLGPFRPTLWAHWELAAELCGGDEFRWRLARLLWSGIATAAMLALLRELRVGAWPALAAAALAMWNPYRNEIWTSLTLSEGVAMPYALAGLWCAARAGRARTAWPWEVASAVCVLVALGCKNTFAALVPAQLYLRVAANGPWNWAGVRRASWLALTLALPVGHYVYFRTHWHPGQYPPTGITLAQIGRELSSLVGAMSIDFLGIGLGLTLIGIGTAYWSRECEREPSVRSLTLAAPKYVWIAGALLALGGLAVYAPMAAMSGRYTMPGVWGLDLMFAALLMRLASVPLVAWRRIAVAGVGCGLVAVAVANVGRQGKFAARADVLWQTLEIVERNAGPNDRVAWVSDSTLNVEEGIHFRWHLAARGHGHDVDLVDAAGNPLERIEVPAAHDRATWAVTGTSTPPPGKTWELRQRLERRYWGGRRQYDCYVWGISELVVREASEKR
ncbi:MAG: hypothetical protein U0746_16230 [Gemmataceae bacterium]